MHPEDTIVALSSAPGPGQRAIVRMSGTSTKAIVATLFDQPVLLAGQLQPGHLRLPGLHSPLPTTLYFFPGPHSYTGQDLAELHTISSPPLVELLLAALLGAGARTALPGEFTQRAFLAGKLDLTRAEAVLAVIDAGTDADLTQALAQLAGGVARPLDLLRDDLLSLLADIEAGLDFVTEDIQFVSTEQTLTRIAAAIAQLLNLRRQLDSRTVSGRAIRVALVGAPNAGKSSLFNALGDGPQALVSAQAGTTRDYLTKPLTLGGVPVELIDTAGLRSAEDTIEAQAQHLGREQAATADVVLWCVEAGLPFADDDAMRLATTGARVVLVRTKCDSGPWESADIVACSAVAPGGTVALRIHLEGIVQTLARPPLAPSQSRCRHHVDAAIDCLKRSHSHALHDDPHELLALELRTALDQLGEMVGAVYTNDLLDRIFSRFCIGK